MYQITANLLGTPAVVYQEKQILFPFRKAEALFYYLLIKKQAQRDELVHLFWGEAEEEVAKKNLRNAVYMIRRAIDDSIILSPQRSILQINPSWRIDCDIDIFLNGGEAGIHLYQGEFLQGFLVKDAEAFEQWMFQQRDHYKDIYINSLHRMIRICLEEQAYQQAENYCKQLIAAEAFDERAYRVLMKIYGTQGHYNKGMEVYHRLVEVLERELSISPDIKTIDVYETLLKERNLKEAEMKKDSGIFYYGREQELKILGINYKYFLEGFEAFSWVVLGEAGIGKSRLLDHFLSSINLKESYVFLSYCYQAEENYLLKPWNKIFSELSLLLQREEIEISPIWRNILGYIFPVFALDNPSAYVNLIEQVDFLKYQVAEKAIVDMLREVAKHKKIMLVFEDVHWMDEMSLSLIKNIIQQDQNRSILILLSYREGYSKKIDTFFAEMAALQRIRKLQLKRFDRKETAEFAAVMLPEYPFTEELQALLYKETEGNPFFLAAALKNMQETGSIGEYTTKIEDILNSRFMNISEESRKILNIASVFFDKVTFQNLLELSGKKELVLIDILEELQNKHILKEVGEGSRTGFIFTHQKLREYVYSKLSLSGRRILHQRIAKMLEKKLRQDKSDVQYYSKLIYHFTKAGSKLAVLKYTIKNLEEYLHFSHEIFPVLNDMNRIQDGSLYLSPQQVLIHLQNAGNLLQEVREEEGSREEIKRLEIAYYHMLGRFHIRQGEYQEGLTLIQKVIDEAVEMKDYRMALKGYRQMIYYCINIQDREQMDAFLEKALKIADESGNLGEMGILMRLKGLQRILSGEYKAAEVFLKEAIEILQSLKERDKYVLNIAAAYNFMGEGKRHVQAFQEAIDHYEKAIELCEGKKLIRGLTTFYTNAGQAAFDMGEEKKAKEYFYKALEIHGKLDSLWGRSTAEGYLALLLVQEGRYEEALQHLTKAEEDSRKLQNPYEIGVILRVKAQIRLAMDSDQRIASVFKDYLSDSVTDYCDEGIQILENLKDCYEIEILDRLKKESNMRGGTHGYRDHSSGRIF
ncbi:tetratricopeptide repeat protein [Geosporobacter ferrireducens]|uniref:Bacterial transcriptional activator domain-containing protein n=1 Tax=Geosporobacter ferrireducens TaxID=1424294 RepID=A0A1D8GGA2_9FIRM|nr:tetratricopeptide repeat protein [Geosporobacter ferrireducens]AOT69938.1 hypothetical protein Gferi_10290 [Geosporobacter ferrireducens]